MAKIDTASRTINPTDVLAGLISRADKAGASAADAVHNDSVQLSVTQRMGNREELERAESREIGLRVFDGQRQAIASTNDTSPAGLDELVERATAMARAAPEDPWCGLAEPNALAVDVPDLCLAEDGEPSGKTLYAMAAEAEDAARAVNGVTNSNGARSRWSLNETTLVTSDGFLGSYTTSMLAVQASVVAGTGTAMETDYAYSIARFSNDLRSASEIGEEAGNRSARRLKPVKADSGEMPVVFEPRVANSIARHLIQAVNGTAIARQTSFLRKDIDGQVFGHDVTIVDDPQRNRGLNSRPFDGEGVATRRINIVQNGVLRSWILSSDSARQLGLPTTGHAARGTSTPPAPSPSNLYMESGAVSPKELIADVKRGVWITDLIGFGVNMVTGDYSRGAAGFMIENGEVTRPISEFTIAGNLRDMFRVAIPANDLVFRYGVDSPTLRIDGMTVAGK